MIEEYITDICKLLNINKPSISYDNSNFTTFLYYITFLHTSETQQISVSLYFRNLQHDKEH